MPSDICTQLAPKLAGVVDDTATLSSEESEHVKTCLACQAEIVSYKKLLRAMHELRQTVVQPSPGILADILDGIGERAERRAVLSVITGRRAAYTGGIAVAAVAGVAGVIIFGRAKSSKSKGRLRRAA